MKKRQGHNVAKFEILSGHSWSKAFFEGRPTTTTGGSKQYE